ncbi:hypothetical protein TCAL_09974 [Tigriopus californicus]|uniref:Diphthine--ammonia ligase n=1 Tax=Tigriopus californicus TaxID=6832 RepID=A0A553P2V0_TIGCA|nr:hypothetical protein TCAL_09974 [Tigriopus californicus]
MSGLKVCALISGGKDSCFSMMECVMAGHQIVALANLKPPHQVQSSLHIDAVCSGAILSDYQRIRVENVCSRLNLISLSFLWRRDQSELLREMISFQMNCVVIKVATLGLDQKHLGQSLAQLQDHLMAMETKFGINVCGEGGEYETFTLDCPLFKKSISIDESKVIVHSADAFAPVAFLHLKSLSLKDKIEQANVTSATQMEMLTTNMEIRDYLRHPRDLVSHCHDLRPCFENCENHLSAKLPDDVSSFTLGKSVSYLPSSSCVSFQDGSTGWFAIGNLPIQSRNEGENGAQDDPAEAMEQVFRQLKECLDSHGWSFSDLVSVTLLVSDMAQYAVINQRYVKNFGINPPIRVCVQTHQDSAVILHALGFHLREDKHFALETTRRTMHVQSISHWAPANIGPYSQYVEVDNVIHIAGQIGLIPGCMELIPGGCGPEAKLSFRHVHRILEAHKLGFQAIAQVSQSVCGKKKYSYGDWDDPG